MILNNIMLLCEWYHIINVIIIKSEWYHISIDVIIITCDKAESILQYGQ